MRNMLFLALLFNFLISESLQKETPLIKWGQNSHMITMIASIPSIDKEEVKFNEDHIYISATDKNGENYEVNLNLLRPIIPEKCSFIVLEIGLKLKIYKLKKEPCWKYLTKEHDKDNSLLKNKTMSDIYDCENEKYSWLEKYKFSIRKTNPKQDDKITKKKDIAQDIMEKMQAIHPSFTLHEY